MIEDDGVVIRPPLVETFDLPTREEILAVRCGDLVKLIFDGECGERMWVRVIEQRSPWEWYGMLANEPVVVEEIRYGARVLFHPLDIIEIRYRSGAEERSATDT